LAQDVVDPKTGEVIAKQHDEITPDVAAEIEKLGLDEIKVRSALTCHSKEGICQKCYGYNLGTQRLVDKGIAVGVIAAQAMGEAATQLTLNTKHLAGRAGTDITQGLPRVAELFEARTPKGKAILADIAGVVTIVVDKDGDPEKLVINDRKKYKKEFEIGEKDVLSFKRSKKVKKGDTLLTREDGTKIEAEFDGQVMVKDSKLVLEVDKEVEQEYELTLNDILVVKDGDQIEKGMPLTAGSISPKELMELGTVDQTQKYIIDNIQETYGIQGIAINDKHVEVIVRQMFRFLRVTTPGDSTYLPGDFVNVIAIEEENRRLKEAGKEPVRYKRVLLGITAASLNTESFLSAASFQEQVRVLTDAALVGKIDNLRGLKENVIIGRPVPLGRELR